MLTILPMAQLICVSNYSYSFVECEGILKYSIKRFQLLYVGTAGFWSLKVSDLLK